MKLDCVLTASNLNPLYCDFIPIFVKTWKKLYPDVDVKVILIAKEIPEQFKEYSGNIILFEPIEGVSTAFISQYIRSLYPALLNYENGVMITDMDILPMNSRYYTENIKSFDNDKFIYYRNVLFENREIAMCYNIATPKTWSEIFNIKNIDDLKNILIKRNQEITYADTHGGSGWSVDQLDLYKRVMEWNIKTSNFVFLKDSETGFRRLDRGCFNLDNHISNNIKSGIYSDYHLLRPYTTYKIINDEIYNLL
jgi:hypothetical protein